MQLWSQFPKEFLGFNCFCSQTLDIQHFSIAASQYRDYNKYDKHNRNNTNSTQRNKSTQSAKILLWAQWYKKLARSRTFRFSVDISCFTSLFLVAIHFRIATKLTKTAALSLGSADTQPPSQHITSSPCFHWWCPPYEMNCQEAQHEHLQGSAKQRQDKHLSAKLPVLLLPRYHAAGYR